MVIMKGKIVKRKRFLMSKKLKNPMNQIKFKWVNKTKIKLQGIVVNCITHFLLLTKILKII